MKTIDQLNVSGRRVLVRLDLNVPLKDGRIADDGKIKACLPTLNALLGRGAKVVACSHLGRPGGHPDPALSLAQVRERLAQLLGRRVTLAADTVGPSAQAAVAALRPGGIVLLENLRFNAGETSEDDAQRGAFAGRLAALADVYVGDAFGAVHRRHASVCDVAALLPHAAGYLVQEETAALRRLTDSIRRPYAVVLGGAKVADKLPVVASLIGKADRILIGGAMAYTFLAAQGHHVGTSLLEGDQDAAVGYLDQAVTAGVEIVLPKDVIVAASRSGGGPGQVVPAHAIPRDRMGLDIGPVTTRLFAARLATARTIFWNGPMGVYEVPSYSGGTRAIAGALITGGAFTMVGGGDTAAAVRALGFGDCSFGHVSTGGGASLEYLEGKMLPGLAALAADSDVAAA